MQRPTLPLLLRCTNSLIAKEIKVINRRSTVRCCGFSTRLEALPQFLEFGRDVGETIGVSLTFVRPAILVIVFRGPPFDENRPAEMAIHYAPSKPLRLNARQAADGGYLIGFGAIPESSSLSPNGDLIEAAANLFDLPYTTDASDRPRIAVARVPGNGLGAAISDRLKRASSDR